MNRKFLAAAGLLLFSIVFTTAHAQDKSQTTQSGPRDLYYSYGKAGGTNSNGNADSNAAATHSPAGRPGAKVRVELQRNGRVQFVSPKTVFQAGDKVRFHFSMNFNGYVVILNEGSSGKRSLLFPYEGVSNRVGMTKDFTVPQGNDWFEFDQTAGEERLTFIMSKREIQEIVQLAGGHPGMTTINDSSDSANDATPIGSDTGETTAATTTAGNAPSHTTSNSTTATHSSTASHPAASPTPHAAPASNNNSTNSSHNDGDSSHVGTTVSTTASPSSSSAPTMSEEQQILAALNARSLQSGRDLSLALDKNEGYVLASDEALAKPVGFKLTLKHR